MRGSEGQTAALREKSDLMGALLVLHAWALIGGSMALFVAWPNPFTFLLAVMVIVAVVARRLNTAPSILLVIAGIALALVPGVPRELGLLINRWLSFDPADRVPQGTPVQDSIRVARTELDALRPALPNMTVGRITGRRRGRRT